MSKSTIYEDPQYTKPQPITTTNVTVYRDGGVVDEQLEAAAHQISRDLIWYGFTDAIVELGKDKYQKHWIVIRFSELFLSIRFPLETKMVSEDFTRKLATLISELDTMIFNASHLNGQGAHAIVEADKS
jgi:hypothetical protein